MPAHVQVGLFIDYWTTSLVVSNVAIPGQWTPTSWRAPKIGAFSVFSLIPNLDFRVVNFELTYSRHDSEVGLEVFTAPNSAKQREIKVTTKVSTGKEESLLGFKITLTFIGFILLAILGVATFSGVTSNIGKERLAQEMCLMMVQCCDQMIFEENCAIVDHSIYVHNYTLKEVKMALNIWQDCQSNSTVKSSLCNNLKKIKVEDDYFFGLLFFLLDPDRRYISSISSKDNPNVSGITK